MRQFSDSMPKSTHSLVAPQPHRQVGVLANALRDRFALAVGQERPRRASGSTSIDQSMSVSTFH